MIATMSDERIYHLLCTLIPLTVLSFLAPAFGAGNLLFDDNRKKTAWADQGHRILETRLSRTSIAWRGRHHRPRWSNLARAPRQSAAARRMVDSRWFS